MADLTPTAANVKYKSGPVGEGTSGATITQGQAVYLDTGDNRVKLAIATSDGPARCRGMIALTAAAAEQPGLKYTLPGCVVDLGGGTAGLVYFVSGATAGALSPHTDVTTPASGERSTPVTVCLGNNLHKTLDAVTNATVA